MAVSIIQIPSNFTPAYNPMDLLVSGTNSTSGNYRLIAKIKDDTGNVIYKKKLPSIPGKPGVAVFDIHRTIENYLSHTVDINLDRVADAEFNRFYYSVEFGEEYGSPTTNEYYYATETDLQLALNAALSPLEFLDFDFTDYVGTYPVFADGNLFLTKNHGTRKLFLTSKAFAYFASTFSIVSGVTVYAFDLDDLNRTTSIIKDMGQETAAGDVFYFPAGPANLNLIPQSQLDTGTSGNVIPANTVRYEIFFNYEDGSSNDFVSETLHYTIIGPGCRYTNYPVYWLGQLGNVDMFNFNKRSDKKSDIKRDQYKTGLGKFLTEWSYGYEASDRQLTNYNTEVQDSIILNTDYLTGAEYAALGELVKSPVVWILQDGDLIPVVVKNSNFDEKQKVNDKLLSLTLEIDFASTTELQRY